MRLTKVDIETIDIISLRDWLLGQGWSFSDEYSGGMAFMSPDGGRQSFRVPTALPTIIRAEFINVMSTLVREVARAKGITQREAFERMPRATG